MTKHYLKDGRTISQFCKEVQGSPPYNTIQYRINTLGWDVDRAVSTPSIRKELDINGKTLRKYCKEHGLKYETVHARWRRLKFHNKFCKKEDITLEQFIKDYVQGVKYEWDWSKYFTNKTYCLSKGLNYRGLYLYWSVYKRDVMTFKEYVDYRYKVKNADTIEDMQPKRYCNKKGYSYYKLYSRYRRSRGFKDFKEYLIQWEKDNGYSSEIT